LSNTSLKISRIDKEIDIAKIKELLENIYTELIIIEQFLCELGKKFNIDENILEYVCMIEVNN